MSNELAISNSGENTAINTFAGTEMDNKTKLVVANALNAALSLKNFEGEVLKIKHVFTLPGERVSRETGELIPCMNTYLIDCENKAYFSQSMGIYRSVKSISALFPNWGENTENGYIEVKVVSQTLPNGNQLKTLSTIF